MATNFIRTDPALTWTKKEEEDKSVFLRPSFQMMLKAETILVFMPYFIPSIIIYLQLGKSMSHL